MSQTHQYNNRFSFFQEIKSTIKQKISIIKQNKNLENLFNLFKQTQQQQSKKGQDTANDIKKLSDTQFLSFSQFVYNYYQLDLIQSNELKKKFLIKCLEKNFDEAHEILLKNVGQDLKINPKSEVLSIGIHPAVVQKLNEIYYDTQKDVKNKEQSWINDLNEYTFFSRYSSHPVIYQIQLGLQKLGYFDKKYVPSGIYEEETEQNIIKFQEKNKILEEGLIGPQTIQELLKIQILSKKESEKNKKLPDIDLTIKNLPKITGVTINKSNQHKLLKSQSEESDIYVQDLAAALKIYYDSNITNKTLSFSLDPYEETNPYGPYFKKVLYPDTILKKNIIQDTEFSEILFEADFLLKQLTLGYEKDGKTPFKYPQNLVKKGIKPMLDFENKSTKNQKSSQDQSLNWCRVWFVCEKVKIVKKNNYLKVDDIKLTILAKGMEVDKNGKLQDALIQDPDSPGFQFVTVLNSAIDELYQNYPILRRLRQLYKAVALAKAMYQNQVPADQSHQTKREEKVEVDIRTIAERSLKQGGHEVNEKNINLIIDQIQKEKPNQKFYDTKIITTEQKKGVFGGVDMNFEVNYSDEQSNSSPSAQQKQAAQYQKIVVDKLGPKSFSSISNSAKSTQISNSDTDEEQKEVDTLKNELPYIFEPTEICSVCKGNLGAEELQMPVDDKYFCKVHHPSSCFFCQQLVSYGKKLKGQKQLYNSQYFDNIEVYFHCDCLIYFQNASQGQALLRQIQQQSLKVNEDLINQIKKIDKNFTELNVLKTKEQVTFICPLCQCENIKTNQVCCQLCQVPNQDQVNKALQEKYSSKK
ncbi:Peptidoglycan binding protein [Pseudocohnilembus persalinus]|uniref:Peptidoglycan binding protein n=1 Tax=Pseudocohnilembus persalinus TaxID=266149 RepID=A0A0V0QX90_PSEPJ|nr:Peptidoglycan binding protein [Pseudocohnilembus persalinus]|eukprot:KRX07017.1 Peptidoglycan binding protein [Pseudocohnilembus persalinus]